MLKQEALGALIEKLPMGDIGFLILVGYKEGGVEEWVWCSEKTWVELYSKYGNGKWWTIFHRIEIYTM